MTTLETLKHIEELSRNGESMRADAARIHLAVIHNAVLTLLQQQDPKGRDL